MKNFLLLLLLAVSATAMAQNKNAKASIDVDGVCGMCKVRIEKAAIQAKGVKSAIWDLDSHMLSLIYNEKKTNLSKISKSIANAGHDTKAFKAPEAAYEAIDMCCKYRDPQVVKDHEINPEGDDGGN